MTIFPLYLAPLVALATTLALIPPACMLARKIGLVDQPGGRKHHNGAIPLIGGLVIFTVYISVGILSGLNLDFYWPLFAALGLILFTGALDDRFEIDAWIKFVVQFSAATLIVTAGNARLLSLGDLFGYGAFWLGFASIPFSVIAVMLLINSINLMDGLDGLAAGKSFIVVLWLMIACAISGQWPPFFALGILAGALAGFLFYNLRTPWRRQARVFLGDAGSMALGLILAWYCIGLAQDPDPVVTPISVAWILALPIIDACGQFIRRVSAGRHPFSPDRGHFHHHFVHAGIPIGESTAIILALGFALGGVGIIGILLGVPPFVLTFAWIALFIVHISVSWQPERYINLIEKFSKKAGNKKDQAKARKA